MLIYLPSGRSELNVKALVGAFNQEKALVGAFSAIVQPDVEPMEHYTALIVNTNTTNNNLHLTWVCLATKVYCSVCRGW